MKQQSLKNVRIRNFKAIRDSGRLKLSPLTVLIGNNGSGKSSLFEALETFQSIVQDGLDEAMRPWHGFQHVWNKAVSHEGRQETPDKRAYQTNPMAFKIEGYMTGGFVKGPASGGKYQAEMTVTMDNKGENHTFIQREEVTFGDGVHQTRNDRGVIDCSAGTNTIRRTAPVDDGTAMLKNLGIGGLGRWQFVGLVPQNMGEPVVQRRAADTARLHRDGRDIAQYLRWIRDRDSAAFAGILEAMQYVLPYARDVQPQLTSEIERTFYLQLTEGDFKVPGWMFSTGTLRVLALLALLRSPIPPALIAVEEIENGLDPRSVNLLLQEMRGAVESGRTQVLVTTHSPYLLDLLDLSHLVLCERIEGEPVFMRPQDRKDMRNWAKSFAPGQLYVMDRLHAGGRQ